MSQKYSPGDRTATTHRIRLVRIHHVRKDANDDGKECKAKHCEPDQGHEEEDVGVRSPGGQLETDGKERDRETTEPPADLGRGNTDGGRSDRAHVGALLERLASKGPERNQACVSIRIRDMQKQTLLTKETPRHSSKKLG